MPEPAVFGVIDIISSQLSFGGAFQHTASFQRGGAQPSTQGIYNTAPAAHRAGAGAPAAAPNPSVRVMGLRPEAIELANRMDTNNV